MLSKINNSKKDKYYMSSFIREIFKKWINNTETDPYI